MTRGSHAGCPVSFLLGLEGERCDTVANRHEPTQIKQASGYLDLVPRTVPMACGVGVSANPAGHTAKDAPEEKTRKMAAADEQTKTCSTT
jgi:hypothetical protein